MKKLISLLLLALLATVTAAQVSKTIDVPTAGTLSILLTSTEKTTVTNLTVTGNIDARDVKCLRDEITVLAVLDLNAVKIMAYSGSAGTYYSYSVSYPANEMPTSSFYNHSNNSAKTTLTSLTLPNSLTTIGTSAFSSCTGITSLTLPNSLTTIGNNAFEFCSGITSLILPTSLTTIDSYAFYYCTGITSLTLPTSLTTIDGYAFYNCPSIKSIYSLNPTPPTLGSSTFKGVNPTIVFVPSTAGAVYKAATGWSAFNIVAEKRVTFNNPTAGSLASALITEGYGPLSSITHLTLTGNLNSVDIISQMKTNMTSLTLIDISGATVIGNAIPANAFQSKTTLTAVTLPSTITSIGDYAFDGCTFLGGAIPLPTALTFIGNYAFQNCNSLTGSLTIPAAVTTIGTSVFSGCSKLTGTLTISNITSIGTYAFSFCSGFTGSLTLPNTITSIGSSAFSGCSGFTGTLTIPNTITSIGSSAFLNCSGFTGTLTIPNTITSIGSSAFLNCSGFTGILTLPNTITTISSSAFSGCSGFTGVLTIPLSVTSIAASAFSACSKLIELNIGKNTATISDNAFNGCTSLTKISIPRSTPPTIYTNTFGSVNKETCILEVPTGSGISYQTANYWSQFVFVNEKNFNTSISTQNVNGGVKVYTKPSEIIIEGTTQGETVALYTVNGVQLQTVKSQGERMVILAHRDAVYLVKTESKTFKVIL